MKVTKLGEFDYDLFINNSEIEKLKDSPLVGKLWNRDYPHDCLDKKIILRLADRGDSVFCGGAGSNFERTEFWIKESVYNHLIEMGRIIGVRYDTGGNKINIFNYETIDKYPNWKGYVKRSKEELRL